MLEQQDIQLLIPYLTWLVTLKQSWWFHFHTTTLTGHHHYTICVITVLQIISKYVGNYKSFQTQVI
jgi:hypothetical protein